MAEEETPGEEKESRFRKFAKFAWENRITRKDRKQTEAARATKRARREDIRASKASARASKAQEKLYEARLRELGKPERAPTQVVVGEKKSSPVRAIFIGIIVILLAFGVFNYAQAGGFERFQVAGGILGETGIRAGLSSAIDFFKTGLNPETYKFTNPSAQSTSIDVLGVNIESFTATRSFFNPNNEVVLKGTIEFKDIGQDINLDVTCEFDNDDEIIYGEVTLLPGDFIETEKGVRKTIKTGSSLEGVSVDCRFPGNLVNLEGSQTEASRRVTLRVTYDYLVQSEYGVYVVLDEKDRDGFFEKQKLIGVNPLIRPGGVVVSTYTGGPIEVNLGLGRGVIKQPLIPGDYDFSIGVVNHKIIWLGEIEELKSLRLILPRGMKVNPSLCVDFDVNGNLRQEILDDFARDECSTFKEVVEAAQESLEEGKECFDKFNKDNEQFFCTINVNKVFEEDARPLVLKARADYVYKIDKSTNVNFVEQKTRIGNETE